MSKFSIDEIMDKLTPDDPTIYARIAIPLDTLIEDIHSYDDFYDYMDDTLCDMYLPKVDCSYIFVGTEYVGEVLLLYDVEIELDYDEFMEDYNYKY